MTWVYFLKDRSEVFSTFNKFKKLVEKQNRCFITTLGSDRGTEYTSNEFNKFCVDEGINRELTVSYTPEQKWCFTKKK